MIFRWFLSHQWKQMTRSSIWQKNVVLNIIIGFLLVLMLLYVLALGLFIDRILEELYPDRDPIAVFNGIILYYLGFELAIRFFLQTLPTLNIEAYLQLPIRKSSLVHYVAAKSIFAFGNYVSWLVFVPFAFKVLAPAQSANTAIIWLIGIILLIFSNNFLATYLKRQLVGRAWIVGVFALLMIVVGFLDSFTVFSLSDLSAAWLGALIRQPLYLTVPVMLVVVTYALNYYFLRSRLYPEELSSKKNEKIDTLSNIKYLKTLGLTGELFSLDLRLIWRHKRTRSMVYMAPLFLGYGFFFYPQEIYREQFGFLIFVGVFMTGGMMINYANYCFSYESNYFDNILANYKDYGRYIRVKYLFGISISIICFVLTIPYVFFGIDILLINTMTFLYNIGLLAFLLFYMATYSTKRMDMSKGAAFNYQGIGASHWLAMVPAFLLPVIIYLPFSLLDMPRTGLLVIGAIGLIGLIFHRQLLGLVLKQFNERRYKMAEGFRE